MPSHEDRIKDYESALKRLKDQHQSSGIWSDEEIVKLEKNSKRLKPKSTQSLLRGSVLKFRVILNVHARSTTSKTSSIALKKSVATVFFKMTLLSSVDLPTSASINSSSLPKKKAMIPTLAYKETLACPTPKVIAKLCA